MRILVIGDFSGRGARGAVPADDLLHRPILKVDVDNFDAVFARLAPRIDVELPGGHAALEFSSIEAFHPDELYRRMPLFQRMRDLRARLQNVATFEAAAGELRTEAVAPRVEPASYPQEVASENDADTMARLLGRRAAPEPVAQANAAAGLDALIRRVVAPHVVREAPQHQAQYVAAVDAAIAAQMRAVLHDARFKALEAAWRGLQMLVTGVETSEALELHVLDANRAELLADIREAQANVESSRLYRRLVEQGKGTTGGEPWSLIVGDSSFGLAGEDVGVLAFLGAVAAGAGGPFLGAALPELLGCESLAVSADPRDWTPAEDAAAEGWHALRTSMTAPSIGLAFPRVLLRLPYGKATDPVSSFAFEELAANRGHEQYLWGNGAYACALLIARAYSARGWDMHPDDERDLEDLPAHVYEADGEKQLQACAEANLTDRAGQAILDAGLIPLLSHKHRNAVRVMRFQSIATPPQSLAGPWR